MGKAVIMSLVSAGLLITGCQQKLTPSTVKKFEPTWESLRQCEEVPQSLCDGKFGMYTHWGPYAVRAYGENTTWYSFALHMEPDGEARRHFEKTFGKLTPDFGYKDLIPQLTAEMFETVEDNSPHYLGFYPQEIGRITMFGDGRNLDWEMTREGVIIETPDHKPCKHAFVFRIERRNHPEID